LQGLFTIKALATFILKADAERSAAGRFIVHADQQFLPFANLNPS